MTERKTASKYWVDGLGIHSLSKQAVVQLW